jgi:hypothetical protein
MPTLIRLFIFLLVLAGLAFGGMIALVAMVKPPDELVTIRIPTRDLLQAPEREPLVQREIDTSRTADSPAPVEPEAAPAADAPAEGPAAANAPVEDGSIVTLQPGVE